MRSAYVPLLCACVHVLRRVSCYFRSRDQMPIRPHPFGAGFTHSVSIKSASALAFTSAAYVSNFSAASVAAARRREGGDTSRVGHHDWSAGDRIRVDVMMCM